MTLNILSYNIHKGFSFENHFALDKIKQAIRLIQADIVFLQEVIGSHAGHKKKFPQWPNENQLEFLADSVWSHHAYGKNAVYSEGDHGNAILSAYPILYYENIDVSTNRFERRGMLHAVIEIPGIRLPLHALCVHFDLFERGRRHQILQLCHRIEKSIPAEAPLIIAGDFNDWRQTITPELKRRVEVTEAFMSINGRHARTFPSWFPFLPLDRIYLRGMKAIRPQCLQGPPWNQLSDHSAISTEVEVAAFLQQDYVQSSCQAFEIPKNMR